MRRELEMDGETEDLIYIGNRLIRIQPEAAGVGAKAQSDTKKSAK